MERHCSGSARCASRPPLSTSSLDLRFASRALPGGLHVPLTAQKGTRRSDTSPRRHAVLLRCRRNTHAARGK
eukprot:2868954-Rhodomonas_salina.1